ncbi:MAG: hypothetical protein MUC36_23730 [Planctomycetes bacterium]|jgi:hypothetical protein|nr:hypothetical protein [Planctomycetota bacterium]
MADRLRWWCVPAGLIVLIGTVALPGGRGDSAAMQVAREAVAPNDRVVLRDATGRRTAPVPLASLQAGAFVVVLPASCRGRRGTLTLWRCTAQGREASPWLEFPAGGRADATVPIAGLAAGRYDVRFSVAIDGLQQTFEAAAAKAPGEVTLRAVETR